MIGITIMTMMTTLAMKTTRNSAETSFLLHIGWPQLTELAWTYPMLTMIMVKMMTNCYWMTTKTLMMKSIMMLVVVVEKPMSSNPQSTPICQSSTHTWKFGSDGSTYHPPQILPPILLLVLVTIPGFLAVQDRSIGDLVSESGFDFSDLALQSYGIHLWPYHYNHYNHYNHYSDWRDTSDTSDNNDYRDSDLDLDWERFSELVI